MLEVLGFTDKQGKLVEGWEDKEVDVQRTGSVLVSADFHGAEMEVVRHRDTGMVGVKGIVVRDTKYTFVLVREGGDVRRVMKKGGVFAYQVKIGGEGDVKKERALKFELFGTMAQYRAVDRAGRKFKWRGKEMEGYV